jgi:hypothetical protein
MKSEAAKTHRETEKNTTNQGDTEGIEMVFQIVADFPLDDGGRIESQIQDFIIEIVIFQTPGVVQIVLQTGVITIVGYEEEEEGEGGERRSIE